MKIEDKFKKTMVFFGAILFLIMVRPVFADEDPIAMLKSVTDRVMSELRANRQDMKHSPQKIYDLVDHVILPHVDFSEMARWVVGRNAWREASPQAQKEFVQEFKTLVVRSYARSLLEYTNQQIEFLPLRGDVTNKQRIQVSSIIKESGKSPIHMDYHLLHEGSTWRVYDIIIEGVSLMQGYRAQFADDVQQGGIETVIEKMHRHNSRG